MMQKRRRKTAVVVIIRRLLICAACVIATAALLSVHAPNIFPDGGYRLPSSTFRSFPIHLRAHQSQEKEQSRTTEITPPILSKGPIAPLKLPSASNNSNFPKLWKPPRNRDYAPCTKPSPEYPAVGASRGYLVVNTNGGLNQMRAGICDMVAVARLINATMIVPELDKRSFWQDSSNFSDIFDEDHFITALASDVRIIKKLPKGINSAAKIVKHFRSWSGMDYYQHEIASLWEEYEVIRAAKSDSRLANSNLPLDIQKLRCRACYEALRFSPRIEAMGKLLVERMRSYGQFIALHLRYEKDMLAFSGCTHGLSASEANELKKIREETKHWKEKDINPEEKRSKGLCPLTPKEVAFFLAGLGYPSNTPIYIAAGEIYGGNSRKADLQSRYPVLMSKEKLASIEELEPFANHSSQMAALDYIVSVESNVFIPSYFGNMGRATAGHRRFLGHKKTIFPDRKAIVQLYEKVRHGRSKEGKGLSNRIIEIHKNRVGSPRRRKGPISGTKGMDRFRSEESFYENPLPECLCQMESAQSNTSATIR